MKLFRKICYYLTYFNILGILFYIRYDFGGTLLYIFLFLITFSISRDIFNLRLRKLFKIKEYVDESLEDDLENSKGQNLNCDKDTNHQIKKEKTNENINVLNTTKQTKIYNYRTAIEETLNNKEYDDFINYYIKNYDYTMKYRLYNGFTNKMIKESTGKHYALYNEVIPCNLVFNEKLNQYELLSENNKYNFGFIISTKNDEITSIINNYKIINYNVVFYGGNCKEYDFLKEKIITSSSPYELILEIIYEEKDKNLLD